MGWHGFGELNYNVAVTRDVKFNGKSCCLITNRKKDYYGLAQHIVRFVENGELSLINLVHFPFVQSGRRKITGSGQFCGKVPNVPPQLSRVYMLWPTGVGELSGSDP